MSTVQFRMKVLTQTNGQMLLSDYTIELLCATLLTQPAARSSVLPVHQGNSKSIYP